jgi:hypothetical protein
MIAHRNAGSHPTPPARRARGRADESDYDYWKSRAQRSCRLAARQDSEHLRNHYLKIAAGYEELARMAMEVRQEELR